MMPERGHLIFPFGVVQLLTLRLAWRGIAARGGASLLPSLSLANGERLTCSWSKVRGRIGGLGLWLGLLLVVVSLPAHSLHIYIYTLKYIVLYIVYSMTPLGPFPNR